MYYSRFNPLFGYLLLILTTHSFSFAQAITNNGKAPKFVYLTWQGNTSTTITVNYHTDDSTMATTVYYGKKTLNSTKKCQLKKQTGYSFRIDSINHRFMHVVELTDLEPGATYYFVAGDSLDGLSTERKFKTIPKNPRSLSFVVGGDMGYEPVVATMMQSAAKKHPDFVFIGGDIAYEDGNINHLPVVDLWFNRWNQFMITDDGYTIPIVTCIGNHEVRGSFAKSPSAAPFYFKFFTQHGTRPYYHRSFGKLISLFVLDTYQVTDLADTTQTHWLDSAMNANQHLKYSAVMALYHVPLYPSYSEFDNVLSAYLRAHWMPIFDNYQLDVAFENHDHALKCTYPMKEGKIDSTGTYYIGDGAWGRRPRDSVATDRNYIRYSDHVLHYWVCNMNANQMKMTACGINGELLYTFTIKLDD